MVSFIPDGQICQAFDPIMILPEKTKDILDDPMKASTSCVAPAYVYLEGSRGKRFLCDFHYEYERRMTMDRTPNLWPAIAQVLIDDREKVKETFDNHNNERTVFGNCWCDVEAFVKIVPHDKDQGPSLFCNFHYRKLYYRYLSNGSKDIINHFDVIDDRKFFTMTMQEEVEKLTGI